MSRPGAVVTLLLGGLLGAGCAAPEPAPQAPPGSAEERAAQCNRLAREVRTWCRTPSGEYRAVSRQECLSARLRLEQRCF